MLNYQRVTIRSERHNELIGPFVSQSIGSHLVHSRMQSERCIHKTIFDTILYPIVQSQLLHNIYIYIHMTTVYCTRTSVSSEVPHRHFNRKTRSFHDLRSINLRHHLMTQQAMRSGHFEDINLINL